RCRLGKRAVLVIERVRVGFRRAARYGVRRRQSAGRRRMGVVRRRDLGADRRAQARPARADARSAPERLRCDRAGGSHGGARFRHGVRARHARRLSDRVDAARQRRPCDDCRRQLVHEPLREAGSRRGVGIDRRSGAQPFAVDGRPVHQYRVLPPVPFLTSGSMVYRFGLCLTFAFVLSAGPATAAVATQDDFFNDATLQEVRLVLSSRDWQTLKDNFGEDTYYPADLTWNGITVRNVGIRSRGHATRNGVKPGLRVDINRYITNQEFLGLKAFSLDNMYSDSSLVRETVTMKMFAKMGL